MKLELKNLAPYLPYGLKCNLMGMHTEATEYDDKPIAEVFLIEGANTTTVEVWSLKTITDEWVYDEVFPILRPLSDLTKEIDHKGERFIPIIEYSYLRFKEIANYKGGQNTMKFIQVREQDLLFELKFDVFGLIDSGLAIDINTLDK